MLAESFEPEEQEGSEETSPSGDAVEEAEPLEESIEEAGGHQCLLNDTDRQRLASLLRLNKPDSGGTPDLGWKLTFWLAMFLAVPASLSMVLGMFPIFGTHGQETLLCLHQYSSLALTLAAMIHVYLVIRRKALCS